MAFFLFLVFAPLLRAHAVTSELPTRLEPVYARAAIAFNQGKFDEALSLLEEVIQAAPEASQPLELKALALKAKGRDAESLRTYGHLARTGLGSQKAKYYFEIGTLLYKNRRYAQARPYLSAAIQGGFNIGASHFFLGLIDYEDKQFEAAEKHFSWAASSEAVDLRPLAQFYLGVIYYKLGYALGAIRGMRVAQDLASQWSKSRDANQRKTAEDLAETSRKVLRTFDHATWFGALTTMVQYDSNVALLPESATTAAQVAGKRTAKQIFSGVGGVQTSPTRTFQIAAAYRFFFNYNYNSDAKNFEFYSHIATIYLNYKPYLRLTPGLKLEGNYTFQNQAGRESAFEVRPYSLGGELGPYARYEVTPQLFTQLDAFVRPQKFYGDVSLDDRRSGMGWIVRGAAEYLSPWRLLAPRAYLSFETNDSEGKNWVYSAFSMGLSNIMRLSPANTLSAALDLSFPRYADRVPSRVDRSLTLRAAWMHELMPHFNFLMDLNYSNNSSTLDSLFSYSRVFGGAGLSYVF